ncbi:MAG: hypothetical protein H7Z20_00650 [Bdellovibrio sp.]|nr:hypothetical protein [Methylotenera sp.]
MNKKLALIIGGQALLIIALFWVLIFYGKDEYEAFQNSHEDEIATPNHISEKDNINVVSLSAATQQNSGITTAKLITSHFAGKIKSTGMVIAIDSLIEAKANYLRTQSEIVLARAASGNNSQQYQRLKTLNEDDKNVSDKVVQDALAAVNGDKAKITATELQLSYLKNAIKLQWGDTLANIVFGDKLVPHLANLLNRKNVLVQVSLPPESPTPSVGSVLNISPLNTSSMIKAVYVSPAAQGDATGYGKTFYYSAPAEQLRIGMRVIAEIDASSNQATSDSKNTRDSEPKSGVVIPNQAIVWFGGKSWAYFKQGTNNAAEDQFVRKPISTDTEIASGWFNQGIDAQSEVVVSGAQLLLSEEFKNQIKNENGD